MKVAILGASGHYGLATAADAEAFRPLAFAMAPVEEGEDMAPVGRALESAPQAGGKPPEAFSEWRKLLDEWKPAVGW